MKVASDIEIILSARVCVCVSLEGGAEYCRKESMHYVNHVSLSNAS